MLELNGMHPQSHVELCEVDIPQVGTGWALKHQSRDGGRALDGHEYLLECPICNLQEKRTH